MAEAIIPSDDRKAEANRAHIRAAGERPAVQALRARFNEAVEASSARDDDFLTVGDALRSLDRFPDSEGHERLVDGQQVFDLLARRGVLPGTKLISTIEALDELPAGTVIRGWNGGVWEIDDTEGGYRYSSAIWSSYFESRTMIDRHGMFTILYRPSGAPTVAGATGAGGDVADELAARIDDCD